MANVISLGRSLEETPTWAVALVTTVMVFVCLLVERSIYRFGKWLKKTRRKALFASLEKIKEELMLLGLISLMLGQWAGWISQICVNSSLFSSRFYLCSEEDYGKNEKILLAKSFSSLNESDIPPGVNYPSSHQCGEGREPFVSYEGLEQLHRFLFVLGVTHVLYSCVVVGLAMSKIYSWRKWENEASLALDANLQDASFEAMWQHLPQFVFRVTCTSGIMTKQNMHQYSNTARVLRGKMDLPPLPFEFSPSPPSKLFSRSRRKLKTNMEEETSEHS